MTDLKDITELGLTAREVTVYLSLAESGKTTAHSLSKRVDMPRASVYFLLEALEKRGLVTSRKQSGTSFFAANPPGFLVKMLEREKDLLNTKISKAKDTAERLAPLFMSRNFSVPKLLFFEGKDAVRRMLYEFEDEWHKSILETDCTWWGFEDPFLFQHYETWYRHIWEKFKKEREEKIKVRVFVDSPEASDLKKRFPGTTLKPLQSHPQFTGTLFLMGEYLLMLVSQQKPHYAFQIKDQVLAANLRVIFTLMWQDL